MRYTLSLRLAPLIGLALMLCRPALAEPPRETPTDEVLSIGPGVTPPRIRSKVEPEYSKEAGAAGAQGTCVIEIVVTREGLPANITVTSPLGYGLDQSAVEAVSKWRFFPAEEDGVPVAVHSTIEVSFRLLNTQFDPQKEEMRTKFNLMVRDILKQGSKLTPSQEAAMWDFAKHDFSSAEYILGIWNLNEANPSRDQNEGLNFLRRAVKNHHPAAMYVEARLQLDGRLLTKDIKAGIAEMSEAAHLGYTQAQKELGIRYHSGLAVDADPELARRYFRDCARGGDSDCQYRLGESLWSKQPRSQSEMLQAIAWLQLAADGGNAGAKKALTDDSMTIDMKQQVRVTSLKKSLLPHDHR